MKQLFVARTILVMTAIGLFGKIASGSPLAPPLTPSVEEGTIFVSTNDKEKLLELFRPDGKPVRKAAVGDVTASFYPRVSPDGKRVAYLLDGLIIEGQEAANIPTDLFVVNLDAKEKPEGALLKELRCASISWSTDGKRLYGSSLDPEKVVKRNKVGQPLPLVSWVYDLKKKAKTPLAVPAGHMLVDISPDGKTLLTTLSIYPEQFQDKTYLVSLDTLKARLLTDKVLTGQRFSPEGNRVLGTRAVKGKAPLYEEVSLHVVSVANGTERVVQLPATALRVDCACWSPDGRRIACQWSEEVPPPKGAGVPVPTGPGVVGVATNFYASRISVADADGSNAKTIVRFEYGQSKILIDWR
jgi:hypothetical protein